MSVSILHFKGGLMKNAKDYYSTRRRFTPEQGKVYENAGGGTYLCLRPGGFMAEGSACMQNVRSGWTFTARGTAIYEDGRIDWDSSSDGVFRNVEKGGNVK